MAISSFKKRRGLLFFFSLFLCLSQVLWGIPAGDLFASSAAPETAAALSQLSQGEITYEHSSKRPEAPRLFLIEDAHNSLDAQ